MDSSNSKDKPAKFAGSISFSASTGLQARTPRKPIHGDPLSPLQARTRIPSAKKPPTLPGFHNAFEVTSPINIRKKGKQRETRFEEDNNVFLDAAPPSSPTPAPATRSRREEIQNTPDPDVSMEDIIPDPSAEAPETSQFNDDEDMMGGDREIIPGPDELAPIEPVIWKDVVTIPISFSMKCSDYRSHRSTISSAITDIHSMVASASRLSGC